jgi:putative DNA primase/helicase
MQLWHDFLEMPLDYRLRILLHAGYSKPDLSELIDIVVILREYAQEKREVAETAAAIAAENAGERKASRRKKTAISFEPSEIGDILREWDHFATTDDTKDLYHYDAASGYYKSDGENYLIKALKKSIPTLKKYQIDEIIYHVKALSMVTKNDFDSDVTIINFQNGLYHIDTMEITPHRPDYLCCVQLPYDYDGKATPEPFENFLSQVLYSEDIESLLDQLAYTFVRTHYIDVINFLIGSGSNGKTVLLGILERLHGSKLVSHVPLAYLMESRFARALLVDKNVNVTTETASITGNDFGVLKELTSPEPQQVERKRKDAHDRVLWAKLWTANNRMPSFTDDSTDGWVRRVNIFEFPNQFEGRNENRKLKAELTTPAMLAGIFNLLKPRINRILETCEIAMAEATIAKRREKLELTTDPVKVYADEWLIAESNSDIEADAMYEKFKDWCKPKKLYIMNKKSFEDSLKNKGYQLSRIRDGNKRRFIWKDVNFVSLTPQQRVIDSLT